MTTDEQYFRVHLKGGDEFDAVTSFNISEIGDDGVTTTSTVFKAVGGKGDDTRYYIVTVDNNNIEYIEEGYSDDVWERLLDVANVELVEDSTATNALFG